MTDYKCIKEVRMSYDGSRAFTKGKIYTAKRRYADDYIFKDDTNDDHSITKEFLEQHFEEIDYGRLDFKIL